MTRSRVSQMFQALAIGLVLAVLVMAGASTTATQVRRATPLDEATAPLAISKDGRTVTFRTPAPDAMRICVEPAADRFAKVVCFTVGDVRSGRVQ